HDGNVSTLKSLIAPQGACPHCDVFDVLAFAFRSVCSFLDVCFMKLTWRHFSPADPATKVPALEQVVPQLILLTPDQRHPLSIGGALNFRCKPFDVCAALKLSDTCDFI